MGNHHRFVQKCFRNAELVISAVLLGAALFFFIGARSFQQQLKQAHPEAFTEAEIVTINSVIDGDEVQVRNASGYHTVVRIAGIKSDDPHTFWGKNTAQFIKNQFEGKEATLLMDRPEPDSQKRLLAYLEIGESRLDLGKSMVAEGMSVVFSKYPFQRIDAYQKTESEAMAKNRGMWGDPKQRSQLEAFKMKWDQERLEKEKEKTDG